MEDPLVELQRAVADDLARERGPIAWLRSLSRAARVALVAAVAAAELGLYAWILLRPDLAAYPPLRMAVVAGAYAVVLLAAAWVALRPVYLPEPRWRLRLVVAIGLLTPFAIAVLPEVPTTAAALAEYTPAGSAYFCIADGTLLAVPLLLVVRLADRRGLRTGSAAAVAAGMLGVLGLQLQCPLNQPEHLLLGHATLPLVLLAGLIALRHT